MSDHRSRRPNGRYHIAACGAGAEYTIFEFIVGLGGFAVDGREYVTIWGSPGFVDT
jgi:hypothetical protein